MSSITSHLLRCALISAALISVPAGAAITPAQTENVRQILAAQAKGQFAPLSATGLQGVPIVEALLTWDRLRRQNYPATFYELSDFLRENRGWPGERDIRRRAEGMVDDLTPMSSRLTYFRAFPAISGTGRFRYAEALLAAGLTTQANTEAKEAWRSAGIARSLETQFLAKFGGILSRDDNMERADRLLWNGDIEAVARMLAFLVGEDRLLVEARIALKRAAAARGAASAPAAVDASAALGRLGSAFEHDPGLVADRSAFLRVSGNSMAARQLMARTRIAPGSAGDRNAWMKEVLANARGAINDNQFDLAFDIAHDHGGLGVDRPLQAYEGDERDTYTSLEWIAGWTALHKLSRPRDAIRHFENFAGAAQFSATRARGLYWAGRAAEAAGITVDANRNFEAAAQFLLAFYGQLAAERLGRQVTLPPSVEPVIAPADRQAFNSRPMVEAARIFGQIGERGRQTMFLKTLADTSKSTGEERLVSELSQQLGRTDYALIASRGELADGPPAILRYAFPLLPLASNLTHNSTMIHAITRQESRFDRNAVSNAGARGLMQLMPSTARETAGKVGAVYRPDGLTGDPNYNILLGSTYYSNLVDAWAGNHVLAVASYNAGSGNVRKWITANGDPRLPGVDTVRWIEEIPIFETRNYVMRVLENAVVYERLQPATAKMPMTNTLSAFLGKGRPG